MHASQPPRPSSLRDTFLGCGTHKLRESQSVTHRPTSKQPSSPPPTLSVSRHSINKEVGKDPKKLPIFRTFSNSPLPPPPPHTPHFHSTPDIEHEKLLNVSRRAFHNNVIEQRPQSCLLVHFIVPHRSPPPHPLPPPASTLV